jgi:sulfate adenylyltransferase subunit 1
MDAASVHERRVLAAVPTPAPTRALRFLTAGSVDDGKSTLIGRLLYDSRAILADQLDALERRAAGAPLDLSLLTDGLEAEREQGITIDVAYRYFATPKRKFIVADAPGHEQYTRNMVTAAAGSDAAVILVDITKLELAARPLQLLPQTRRHALLAQLLRVPGLVFAINKLDAVDDPGAAYAAVREAVAAFAHAAGLEVAGIVPVSALRGDNVTRALDAPWYRGPSLLELLERLPAAGDDANGAFALPVQYVARPGDAEGAGDRRRTFWGRVASGQVAVGAEVEVFPGGQRALVADVLGAGAVASGSPSAGRSIGLVLDRQLDVSRGDWLATPGALRGTARFSATLAWLDTEPAVVGRRYRVRHGHRWIAARIVAIADRLDIGTLARTPADALAVNEIGRVQIETQQPLPVSPYADNRGAGALIVVDPSTHRTSGALLVEREER